MPNTYITTYRRVSRIIPAAFSRHGVKAVIVALGTGVSAGPLQAAPYVPTTHVAQHAVASAATRIVEPDSVKRAGASRVAPGGLDAGIEHQKITFWVKQFSKFKAGF